MKNPFQISFWRSRSRAESEEKELVEFSEYLLVLSPSSLWEQWKMTDAAVKKPAGARARSAAGETQRMDEPLVSGSYTTQRDGGLTYDYQVFGRSIGDMVVWYSRVSRDGVPKGRPSGTVDLLALPDVEAQVTRVVELHIEELSGIVR